MKITFACYPGLKNYVPLYSNNNDSNYDNDIIDMMNSCCVDDFSDSYYDIIDMTNSCCVDDFSDSYYDIIDMMNSCCVDDFSDSYDIIDMMNSCCGDDFSDSYYRLASDKLSSWGRGLGGVQG